MKRETSKRAWIPKVERRRGFSRISGSTSNGVVLEFEHARLYMVKDAEGSSAAGIRSGIGAGYGGDSARGGGDAAEFKRCAGGVAN